MPFDIIWSKTIKQRLNKFIFQMFVFTKRQPKSLRMLENHLLNCSKTWHGFLSILEDCYISAPVAKRGKVPPPPPASIFRPLSSSRKLPFFTSTFFCFFVFLLTTFFCRPLADFCRPPANFCRPYIFFDRRPSLSQTVLCSVDRH